MLWGADVTQDDLNFIEDMQASVRRGAGVSAIGLQEVLQIVTTLRAELASAETERDALRHDVEVACHRADEMRCNWERTEAECAELRERYTLARDGGRVVAAMVNANGAEIRRLTAERDALQAWKDAVPMDDIRIIAQEGQLQSWWEIKSLNRWLATLDGAA